MLDKIIVSGSVSFDCVRTWNLDICRSRSLDVQVVGRQAEPGRWRKGSGSESSPTSICLYFSYSLKKFQIRFILIRKILEDVRINNRKKKTQRKRQIKKV
jgi:hypothetical protein